MDFPIGNSEPLKKHSKCKKHYISNKGTCKTGKIDHTYINQSHTEEYQVRSPQLMNKSHTKWWKTHLGGHKSKQNMGKSVW